MIRYLIDGYNLLHAIGILAGKIGPHGLERARHRLCSLLAAAFGEKVAEVTVVFDGPDRAPSPSSPQDYKGVQVEFAVGAQEADDVIESHLASHSAPRKLSVVSNDRRVQTAARRRKAGVLSCDEFLERLDELGRKKRPQQKQDDRRQSRLSQDETRHWLQEFAGLEDEPELKEALKPFDFEIE